MDGRRATPRHRNGMTVDAPRRSAGALKHRRSPRPWPEDRPFRILSIDGGGIRGIFPATFLTSLEKTYLSDESVADYFDLIAGTSTGGIIALGLASGLRASRLRDAYVQHGHKIFPPPRTGVPGTVEQWWNNLCRCFRRRYDRAALLHVLQDTLGDRKLGEATSRLCIPSLDGRYGEVYIFKTPHHPDFRKDSQEPMTKVAAATAAAPTYFSPLSDGGYTFVDGGVWANNPVMIALVDALTCFDVSRSKISILSLGCGNEPYLVGRLKFLFGGMLSWRDIIFAAMRLESQNALGQAGLLIGADKIMRVDVPESHDLMMLDDWERASQELPPAAERALAKHGKRVKAMFLTKRAAPYTPVI